MKLPRQAFMAASATLLAPAFVLLAGCNVIGSITAFFKPTMPIAAQYPIEKKKRVVVIVDDYHQSASSPALAAAIASAASHHLAKDGKFQLVSDGVVREAISKLGDHWTGKHGASPVSAASVGAALHADVVVYANIESAQILLADHIYQPQVVLSVKLYETTNGRCLFPEAMGDEDIRSGGFVIESNIPARNLSASGISANMEAENKLAAQAGLDLAQLFYSHQPQKTIDPYTH